MKASVIAALLPALISAAPSTCPAPAPPAPPAEETFTLITIHSGNQYVHNQAVNANGGLLWVGKPTTSFCPDIADISCPPGTVTAFVGTIGGDGVSTSHEVPGEQILYIQGPAADTPGSLAFNPAHASAPTGSILGKFKLTETDLEYVSGDWLACPAMGAYYITTAKDSDFCISVNLHVIPYTGPTPAAWQYE